MTLSSLHHNSIKSGPTTLTIAKHSNSANQMIISEVTERKKSSDVTITKESDHHNYMPPNGLLGKI